jgi:hypothetical protein
MEAGHLRDDVLVRVGLGVEEWIAAQTEWLAKMGAEIERGRFELTNRYSQAFLERQRALRALATATLEAPREAVPRQQVPSPMNPPSPPVAAEVPSFLLPVSPPIPAPIVGSAPGLGKTRAPASLSGTSMGFIAPKGAALPFAKTPVAPPQGALPPAAPGAPPRPAPPPRPVVNRAPASLSGTSMGFIPPKTAALPFAKAPAPPAATPDPTRPMAPLFAAPTGPAAGLPFDGQSTMGADPSKDPGTALPARSPLAPALPFAAAGAQKPLPPAAPAPAPKAAPAAPRAAAAPDPMDMTTMGAISPFARVMPFAAVTSAPAAPAPAPPRPPAPAPVAAAPAPAASAPAPAPVIIGGYTLEQHVSLCADLTFTPARAAETLARYRITVEGKAELDRLWKERFVADPALEARWREAHGMYLKFLATRRA